MTNLTTTTTNTNMEFTDFPEDVHLSILSFLTPSEISSFASTSKRFLALCRSDSKLWFSLCHRRFGSKTHITKWANNGNITFKSLYKTLIEYENLIGFWRLSSSTSTNQTQTRTLTSSHDSGFLKVPGLVFFEWGESFITGFKVSPSRNGSYEVVKEPFLYMGISPKGEIVNFLEMGRRNRADMSANAISDLMRFGNNGELVSVDVNHMGQFHIVIEERGGFGGNVGNDELVLLESGSPPDRITSEIYQYFANRTSPSGRRQRRREKERNGNKKWEAEHFVKIVNYCPTSVRPLQGLWKEEDYVSYGSRAKRKQPQLQLNHVENAEDCRL